VIHEAYLAGNVETKTKTMEEVMYHTKTIAILAILILASAVVADTGRLKGRHQLDINLGEFGHSSAVSSQTLPGTVSMSVKSSGFAGGISYSYWLSDNTAMNLSIGSLRSEYESSFNWWSNLHADAVTVVPVLLGVKQYVGSFTEGSTVRPFVSAAAGSYFGRQAGVVISNNVAAEARDEQAFGGRIGGGVDFFVSSHFTTGVNLGYNLVSDFDAPIGGSDNYSGPEMKLSFGYIFGSGGERRAVE